MRGPAAPSDDQRRQIHATAFAAHDHDAGLGNVIAGGAVLVGVESDDRVFGNAYVLVEDGALDLSATSDVAIVQDDAAIDRSGGVNAHAAAQHRVLDHAAG